MQSQRHPFLPVLLALCLLHLAIFGAYHFGAFMGVSGFLFGNGTPVGGDFINLWAAARLVLEGRVPEIYDHTAFMAYQVGLVGSDISTRFWAYPPHSLLTVWPFGLVGYFSALLIWSALGLLALGLGCRRMGLGAMESLTVLVSPASVLCLYYGQTGNLATGLLLMGLAGQSKREWPAIVATALLTMKPQMGLMVPVVWLAQKRWRTLLATTLAVVALLIASFFVPGMTAWADYLSDTVPGLSLLERQGTGLFVLMMPSVFMALRIVTDNGDLALALHGLVVLPVLAFAIWRLWTMDSPVRQAGLALATTALVTPYLHNYDLSLIAVSGLLVLRRFAQGRGEMGASAVVVLAFALPQLVLVLNMLGLPLAPLVLLALVVLS